jgi:hypothetical protein
MTPEQNLKMRQMYADNLIELMALLPELFDEGNAALAPPSPSSGELIAPEIKRPQSSGGSEQSASSSDVH